MSQFGNIELQFYDAMLVGQKINLAQNKRINALFGNVMADKNVTITDIAKRAAVSKKSVSRVINDEDGVSQKTREHIQAIIKETGYQPDRRARALAGQNSYLLALAYNNRNPAYVLDLLQGALEEANRLGFEIILHPVSGDANEAPSDLLQLMRRSGADGLVLTPPLSESFHMFDGFRRLERPIVRIASDDVASPIPQISFDDRAAAFDITTYLLTHGYRKIAFVGGPQESGPTRRRFAGFKDAMHAQKSDIRPEWLVHGDFTFVSGVDAGTSLLSSESPPEAVMCSNDEMAAGIIHAARGHGLRVPDNLAVTGFDDAPIAQQVWPPLTTVRQPLFKMGSAAIDQLVTMIKENGVNETPQAFPHSLIERQSVKPISQ